MEVRAGLPHSRGESIPLPGPCRHEKQGQQANITHLLANVVMTTNEACLKPERGCVL